MAEIQEVEAFEEQQTYTDVMKKLEEIREKNKKEDIEEKKGMSIEETIEEQQEIRELAEFENRMFEGVITSGKPTDNHINQDSAFTEEYREVIDEISGLLAQTKLPKGGTTASEVFEKIAEICNRVRVLADEWQS